MGCNCGGKKSAPSSYEYTSADKSKVQVFRSQVEARAQQIRDGGGGTIKPVSR